MKAAIYTRVSTEEQRDYGYSIDGQIRELKDYCVRKKYDVIGIYNDAGFSGKNMNRPELERLLDDIKKGLVDVVVAIKVDRLTRDGYDGQWLLKYCQENDVLLDLMYEQFDVNTSNGEMMYGMNLLFAQRERKEIGARTKKGLEEAVRQGKYPTQCPLGYIRNLEGKLEIDPVSSLVIKEIFELYSTGMSMNAIAIKLQDEGRFNKFNTKWREDKILKIIANPIYKGECHWRRTVSKGKQNPVIVLPNHSPKIVSEELFDKCQNQVIKNKHGGYGEHIHIFHNIVKCPYCNKPMSNYFTIKKRASGDKEFYYVICKNPTCDGKSKIYSTEKIENALIQLLHQITIDYKQNEWELLLPNNKNNTELDFINKALSKLKTDESKLLELYLNSSINVEVINKKNEQIQNDIKKLELQKSKYETVEEDYSYNNLVEMFKEKDKNNLVGIDNLWDLLDRKDKKKIISKYIKTIEIITDNKYNIAIKDIVFYKEFIKFGVNQLTSYALLCIEQSNEKLVFKNPVLETEIDKTHEHYSIYEFMEESKKFRDEWREIIKQNSVVYPIVDLRYILKDMLVVSN